MKLHLNLLLKLSYLENNKSVIKKPSFKTKHVAHLLTLLEFIVLCLPIKLDIFYLIGVCRNPQAGFHDFLVNRSTNMTERPNLIGHPLT